MKTIEDAVRENNGEWPFNSGFQTMYWDRTFSCYAAHLASNTDKICTRTEFEECTRRLRGEPSWKDAPDWAMAKAQNSDGGWYWYEIVPRHYTAMAVFISSGGKSKNAGKGEIVGNWRDTLRLRPEEKKMGDKTETEMLISMLDYHKVPEEDDHGIKYSLWGRVCAYRSMGIEEIRLQMRPEEKKAEDKNDWHAKGELPPAGTVCRLRFATTAEIVVTITYVGDGVLCYRDEKGMEYTAASDHVELRPLQTEREQLIEEAIYLIEDDDPKRGCVENVRYAIDLLARAGMLKMPEDNR